MARIAIPNDSMRGVRPGLPARLTVDAFPKSDFGCVDARVASVEPDANDAGQYVAWLVVRAQDTGSRALVERLRPGLQVEAQIVSERRRLLDLLLSPIRRAASGPLAVTSR
jgi:hypothetical protein